MGVLCALSPWWFGRLKLLRDAAATEHHVSRVAAVEHGCLPGGDGALWRVEAEMHPLVIERGGGCCRGGGVGAHLHLAGEGLFGPLATHKAGSADGAVGLQGGVVGANHKRVAGGVYCGDKEGFGAGDAESFALPNGVEWDSLMVSNLVSLLVEDGAGHEGRGGFFAQKAAVVFVGDEADILAFAAVGGFQPAFLGEGAHLVFAQGAQGEVQPGKFALLEHIEHIGLVAGVVYPAQQGIASDGEGGICRGGGRDDAGVVAGCHCLTAKLAGVLSQGKEFDVAVAGEAGVGGGAAGISFNEEAYNLLPKRGLIVEQVVGDAEPLTYFLRVGHGLLNMLGVGAVAPLTQDHCCAHNVVALFVE